MTGVGTSVCGGDRRAPGDPHLYLGVYMLCGIKRSGR